MGRAEKEAGGFGRGLESKSMYKVIVRNESGGRKARNQNTKKF